MKFLLLTATILTTFITAHAYDPYENPSYVYISSPRVNLRWEPSITSAICRTASYGEYFFVWDILDEWYMIDDPEEGPESTLLFVNKNFANLITGNCQIEHIDGKSFSFDDGNCFGILSFSNPDSGRVEYSVMIKSRELQESGGNGVLDMSSDRVEYVSGCLSQPSIFWDSPVVYDKNAGKLLYYGMVWDED